MKSDVELQKDVQTEISSTPALNVAEIGVTAKNGVITASAINSLKWNIDVPDSRIKVDVEDGWVTLSGTVDWEYQRSSAETSIQVLAGVKGVIDDIEINPSLEDEVEKVDVINALGRDAFIDDDDYIVVEVATTVLSCWEPLIPGPKKMRPKGSPGRHLA